MGMQSFRHFSYLTMAQQVSWGLQLQPCRKSSTFDRPHRSITFSPLAWKNLANSFIFSSQNSSKLTCPWKMNLRPALPGLVFCSSSVGKQRQAYLGGSIQFNSSINKQQQYSTSIPTHHFTRFINFLKRCFIYSCLSSKSLILSLSQPISERSSSYRLSICRNCLLLRLSWEQFLCLFFYFFIFQILFFAFISSFSSSNRCLFNPI